MLQYLMAWKEKLNDDDSYRGPSPKTKSSLKKLLEVVKSERLAINSACRTSRPVKNGKNARKFPDSKRDFPVEFTVTSQNGKVSLPICYDQFAGEDETPTLRYALAITSVQRYSNPENKMLHEEAERLSYCCCPLLKHRSRSKRNRYGFWFRLFGRKVTFRITVAVKLCGVQRLTRFDGSLVDLPAGLRNDGEVVCSRVFEFVNSPRKIRNGRTLTEHKPAAKITPSLYVDEDYEVFMNSFKSVGLEEVETFLSKSVKEGCNKDLQVVAQLEQSREACRRGQLEKAKQTVRDAVDLVSKCSSKVLLTGRAYLYLAGIHFKDGCLGNVEECLHLARKKLENIESCEDVGDLCFQEGQMLVMFLKRVPRLKAQLVPKARDKFQEAAVHYSGGLSSGCTLEKLCSTHIQLALLAQEEKETDSRTSLLEEAQEHVKFVGGHIANLSHQVKFDYFICYSKLLLEMNLPEKAREKFVTALQIAEASVGVEGSFLGRHLVEDIHDQLHGNSHQDAGENSEVVIKAMATLDDHLIDVGYLGDVSE